MLVADAQKKLAKAVKRLVDGQGDRTRRNARTAVASAIRTLKAAIDEHFPPPARKPRVSAYKAKRYPGHVVRKYKKRGHVELGDTTAWAYEVLRRGRIETVKVGGSELVPKWVDEILTITNAVPQAMPATDIGRYIDRAKHAPARKYVIAELHLAVALANSKLGHDVYRRAKQRLQLMDCRFRDALLAAADASLSDLVSFVTNQIGEEISP